MLIVEPAIRMYKRRIAANFQTPKMGTSQDWVFKCLTRSVGSRRRSEGGRRVGVHLPSQSAPSPCALSQCAPSLQRCISQVSNYFSLPFSSLKLLITSSHNSLFPIALKHNSPRPSKARRPPLFPHREAPSQLVTQWNPPFHQRSDA